MDKKEKLSLLRELSESNLRENVLKPLFEKMGYKDVIIYHGTVEKGKDIIFYDVDRFGDRIYYSVVVKKESIDGSSSSSSGSMTILNQILQSFNEPYTDIYNLKSLIIDRCCVVTPQDIKPQAIENVSGSLKKLNLDKLVQYIDGNKLLGLMEQYMPDYFFKEYEGFRTYFETMQEDFETIKDVSAIGQPRGIPLEKIYVSLKLSESQSILESKTESEEVRGWEKRERDEEIMSLQQGEVTIERKIDADSAVKDYSHIVIVGDPGAGKTTLLKHLALKLCKENLNRKERVFVPVWVTLRELVQAKNLDLRSFIDETFETYKFPEAKNFVEQDLITGKCILLLDGFDELATIENQEKISTDILEFADEYPKCRIVVTSRTAGYHDELDDFTKLGVKEFDDNQIRDFVYNWFGKEHSKKANSMINAIKEHGGIGHLARNPLMISIIAIIYDEDKTLPQRRVELYQRATEVLLFRWEKNKDLANKYKADQKLFILKKLAFENHKLNRRVMPEEWVIKNIEKYSEQIGLRKDESMQFLEEIWQRSFLLRQIAIGQYDFLHLSFQEYFSAIELNSIGNELNFILSHLNSPWWEEPILLYAGLIKDASALIKAVQKKINNDTAFSHHKYKIFLGKVITIAEFTDPKVRKQVIDMLWKLYEGFDEYSIRSSAISVLALLKPKNIIDRLKVKMHSKKISHRFNAAKVLEKIGNTDAVPILIKTLREDANVHVRWQSAIALGSIGSDDAVTPLINALQTDQDSTVRGKAAEALGRIGSKKAIPVLNESLKDSSICFDQTVRGISFEAIKKIEKRKSDVSLGEEVKKKANDKSNSRTLFKRLKSTFDDSEFFEKSGFE